MEKNYICRNAICKYDGTVAKSIRALLVKLQYPNGSTYASKDDYEDIGDIIKKKSEMQENERVAKGFPKFKKAIF